MSYLWHPKHWLSWVGVFFIFLISCLPQFLRHGMACGLAFLAYRYNHKRRQIVLANLAYCFQTKTTAEIETIARQHFFYLAIGLVDYSVLWFASIKRLQKMVLIENKPLLDQIVQKNAGVLMCVAHSPFVDFIAPGLSQYSALGSYKVFKNPVVEFLVLRSREKFLAKLVDRDTGFRVMVRSLKQAGMFLYAPDEDKGVKHSVFTPFFDSTKATLTTVARLSQSTDCLCVPTLVVWDEVRQKYIIKITEPIEQNVSADPVLSTQQMNHALESLIEPDIAQYMWTMKFFRTRPEGEADIY